MRAVAALVLHDMRAERLPHPQVAAFAEQVFVHLAEDRAETIGILEIPARVSGCTAQMVGRIARHLATEDSGRIGKRIERVGV